MAWHLSLTFWGILNCLQQLLAPLNRFKPSSKIFYWPFQGGTFFVDLLCFCSVLCLLCFVRVCLYVLCGHLLGKGWPLGSRLWCLLWVCHFPIGILGQVWYLIVSIPDLCTITYFYRPGMYHLVIYFPKIYHSGEEGALITFVYMYIQIRHPSHSSPSVSVQHFWRPGLLWLGGEQNRPAPKDNPCSIFF